MSKYKFHNFVCDNCEKKIEEAGLRGMSPTCPNCGKIVKPEGNIESG